MMIKPISPHLNPSFRAQTPHAFANRASHLYTVTQDFTRFGTQSPQRGGGHAGDLKNVLATAVTRALKPIFQPVDSFWVKPHQITIPGLTFPNGADKQNLRIVQFSDMHFYEHTQKAFVDKVVDTITNLKPDLLIFSGDLVHAPSSPYLAEAKKFLARLPKDVTKIACIGNHDRAHGRYGDVIEQALRDAGFEIYVNEAREIQIPSAGTSLMVSFLDDAKENKAKRSKGKGKTKAEQCQIAAEYAKEQARQIWQQVDNRVPHISLSHNPLLAQVAEDFPNGPSFIFSGDTHGNQIVDKDLPTTPIGKALYPEGFYNTLFRAVRPEVPYHRCGWKAVSEGTLLYVNCGTGSVMPLPHKVIVPETRKNTQAEISVFDATAAPAGAKPTFTEGKAQEVVWDESRRRKAFTA